MASARDAVPRRLDAGHLDAIVEECVEEAERIASAPHAGHEMRRQSALPLQDLQYGPQAAFISESFPGSLRYSGAGLGYQLASITSGGPAPIFAAILLRQFGTSRAIAVYMSACSAVSLASVYMLTDRSGTLDHQ